MFWDFYMEGVWKKQPHIPRLKLTVISEQILCHKFDYLFPIIEQQE